MTGPRPKVRRRTFLERKWKARSVQKDLPATRRARKMADSILSEQEHLFIAEYIRNGGRPVAAAALAGYDGDEEGAVRWSRALLRRDDVWKAICARREELAVEAQISQERIVAELKSLAFSDMRGIASWGPEGVALTSSEWLMPDQAAAVKKIGAKDGNHTIELHDKIAALDKLGKYLGMFKADNDQKQQQDTYQFIMVLHGQEPQTVIEMPAKEVSDD